jgi:hypothetical protein
MSDINIKFTDCPYAITKFEDHANLKDTLLKSIKSMPDSKFKDNGQIINTDWNLPKDTNREYWNILEPSLTKTMIKVYGKLNFNTFAYVNYWFQQYYKNNYHNWHVHGDVNWTNIYYLELNNNDLKTNILNQKTNLIVIPDVYEGSILTMPSMLWHQSPNNISNDRKTVIVFNTTTPY